MFLQKYFTWGNLNLKWGKKTYYFEGGMGPNFSVYFAKKKHWLVIELGRDIMPTNIFTKFDKDRTKTL